MIVDLSTHEHTVVWKCVTGLSDAMVLKVDLIPILLLCLWQWAVLQTLCIIHAHVVPHVVACG